MGYRVGGQCFATSEEASDYKMSMVVPAITADGQIQMPVRKSDGWYYGTTRTVTKPRPYPYTGNHTETVTVQNKIVITHPQCNPLQPLKDGIETGMYILPLFMISFFVRLVIRVIRTTELEERKDS